jgi:murein DD-endopeptidase MepM/ murein hydrolase activator NlpD
VFTPRRLTVLAAASAALVALCVPVAFGASLYEQKNAVDQHIASLRSEIQHANDREGVLTTDIANASSQIDALSGDIDVLTAKLTALESDLAAHRARLARLQERYREQTERLERLTHEHAVAQRRLEARLVELYESNEANAIEILLQAQSFSDLLEQLDYFRAIGERDKEIAETIKRLQIEVRVARAQTAATKADVAEATAVLARETAEKQEARAQLIAQGEALAAARASKQSLLAGVRQERDRDQEDLETMQAASASLAAKIREAQESAPPPPSGSGGSGGSEGAPSSSGFIWPVSGPITSGFGPRWGSFHEGIDIGAACGTPIRAAASGTIIYAGWMDGYGNIVIIDHGGGLATAYGHQSAIYVSGGAVSQGQVIGAVGSTGHSTGCHLHFEVRVNGSPVDPLGYL